MNFTRELMIYKSRFLLFRKSQFAQITTGGPMSKYEYKKMYLAIYLCLIAVGAFSMMARWINNINPELKILPVFFLSHITNFALFLSHITNFALCMMVLLIFGFVFICFGGKLKIITIVTTVIALIGVVYECFLPFLNTPDIWDAVFGVTGTAVAYIYLVMLKRNGLVAK